jgi:hypothetical protein
MIEISTLWSRMWASRISLDRWSNFLGPGSHCQESRHKLYSPNDHRPDTRSEFSRFESNLAAPSSFHELFPIFPYISFQSTVLQKTGLHFFGVSFWAQLVGLTAGHWHRSSSCGHSETRGTRSDWSSCLVRDKLLRPTSFEEFRMLG